MTTRASLRTTIRSELNDSGGTPLWSDALLNEWLNQGIRAYSRELPEEATATLVVVADQAGYALPARTFQVLRVEQPRYSVRLPISGSRTSADGAADLVDFQNRVGAAAARPGYRVFAGSLILDPAPTSIGTDEDVRLEYLRLYAEPATDNDVLATPVQDDDVLVHLVCASALEWVASDEAKRLRYQGTQGLPPELLVRWHRRLAASAIAARTSRLRTRTLEIT